MIYSTLSLTCKFLIAWLIRFMFWIFGINFRATILSKTFQTLWILFFHFLETTKQHTQDLQSSYQSSVCKVYIKVAWFVFICCRQQHEGGNCSDLGLEDFVSTNSLTSTNSLRSNVPVLNSLFIAAYPVQRTSKISNRQNLANFLPTLTLVTLFNRYKNEHLLSLMNNARELNCWS